MFRGLVKVSKGSSYNDLYDGLMEVIFDKDSMYFVRDGRVILEIPYGYLYSIEHDTGQDENEVVLRYLDPNKVYDTIYIHTSELVKKYITNILRRILMGYVHERIDIDRDVREVMWKVLYLIYKKVPFRIIAEILDISMSELVGYLNILYRKGYLDSRGYPTFKGQALIKSKVSEF